MDRLGSYDSYLAAAARDAWEAEQIEADWQPCAHCDQAVGPQDDIEWLDDGGMVHLVCFLAVQQEGAA